MRLGPAVNEMAELWQITALTLREQVLTFAEKHKRSRTNALFFRVEVMLKCGCLQEGNHKQTAFQRVEVYLPLI